MQVDKQLLEAFTVVYREPVLPAIPDDRFMVGVHKQFPEVNLYKKRFAAVTAEGLAFSSSEKLFELTKRTQTGRKTKRSIFFMWLKQRFRKFTFTKKAILVFDDWSGNYFHFWNDLMPRLYLCKEVVKKKKLTILADTDTARLANQLFPLFGFADIKCITSKELCFAAELYYPEFISINVGSFHEATLKGMKNFIFEKLKLAHSTSKKERIYISRSKAKYRKINNEDELNRVLIQYGFSIVFTEDLSVLEQIRLFKDAEAVMGLHGAGLSNMLFCESGTKVIEIRPTGGVQNNLFYQLASTLGHPYYCFFSENAESENFQQADVSIDTNLFTQFLENIYPT